MGISNAPVVWRANRMEIQSYQYEREPVKYGTYLPLTGHTQGVATQITIYVPFRRAYHVPLPLLELAPNERPCEHGSRGLAPYFVPVLYVIVLFLLGGDWRLWPCRDSCPGKGINGPLESNSVATHIADQID